MNKPWGPVPARSSAREELSPARRAALDTLADLGGRRTVAELAGELGQHPNTAREHLEALVGAGLVERSQRSSTSRGRPAALYRATLAAAPAGPEYAVLAEVLITYLARAVPDAARRAEHARAAGRDWGRAIRERYMPPSGATSSPGGTSSPRGTSSPPFADSTVLAGRGGPADNALHDSVRRLGGTFDRAGFDAETTVDPDGGYTQRLRSCPVLALARQHPDVVCASHLGMAQEILEHEGVAADRVSLDAFAEPGACLLRVAPQAAGDD